MVRILVADDEAAVRGLLRKLLEQGGYEVIEAADGRQARAGHVDLVITDLVMPEQEGTETIQALCREVPGRQCCKFQSGTGVRREGVLPRNFRRPLRRVR